MNIDERIISRWTDCFFSKYPIKPIDEIIEYVREATTTIYKGVMDMFKENKKADIGEALDDLMRFLASDTNMSPGDSIRLIGNLKYIIAEELNLDVKDKLKLFEVIDEVVYEAFNYYMKCREKIFELRLKEKDRELEIMRKILECASRVISRTKP